MGSTCLARCGEVFTMRERSRPATGTSDRHSSATNHRIKHQAFRVAGSERVHFTNACRRASSN